MRTQASEANPNALFTRDASIELEGVFNAAADGMLLLDTDFNIRRANDTFLSCFGWTREEVEGRKCREVLCVADLCGTEDCPLARILNGASHVELDLDVPRKDRALVPCIVSAKPLKAPDGDVLGVVESIRDVSESKKAELAVKLLSQAIESSPACIVITDRNGNIEYVNRKFEELTGYTTKEALGKNPRILKSPDTPRGTYVELWQSILSGRQWSGKFRNVKKSGEYYFEEARIAPIFDDKGAITHFVAVKEDVTERLRLQEALRHMAEELEVILDTLPAWVFYKDKENRFIRVNKTFADVMGMSKEQLAGASCFALYPKEQADDFWKDDLEVISSGKPKVKIVETVTLADGLHWVQTEKIPFRDERGRIIGIIGFASDITERKIMEDEIRSLAITDELTGLSNRRGFFGRVEDALKFAQRRNDACMLLVADLDGLKWINDNLGHSTGDEAIVEAANILRSVFRKSDIIARLGGDEFAVFTLGAGTRHARTMKERLDAEIERHNALDGRRYALSMSYGMAFANSGDAVRVAEMMSRADRLMYEHKRAKPMPGTDARG